MPWRFRIRSRWGPLYYYAERRRVASQPEQTPLALPPSPSDSDAEGAQQGKEDKEPFEFGRGWLRALVAYGRKVFGLRQGLEAVQDKRQDPVYFHLSRRGGDPFLRAVAHP